MRSTLAGKNMRIIIGSEILTPNGLTIDHKAEKLYFSDGSLGKIERCDYDGSGRYVSIKIKTLNLDINCDCQWHLFFIIIFLKEGSIFVKFPSM